ncbi:MAG: hypothetical protein AAGH15_01385 [Myxococcota bacterium]
MLTPFLQDLSTLSLRDQLVELKGCVLCRITRDLENGRTTSKSEWRECKTELGVPVRVVSLQHADPGLVEATGGSAPAVLARTQDGVLELLLDEEALRRCNGRVADLRGRLLYRARARGLAL